MDFYKQIKKIADEYFDPNEKKIYFSVYYNLETKKLEVVDRATKNDFYDNMIFLHEVRENYYWYDPEDPEEDWGEYLISWAKPEFINDMEMALKDLERKGYIKDSKKKRIKEHDSIEKMNIIEQKTLYGEWALALIMNHYDTDELINYDFTVAIIDTTHKDDDSYIDDIESFGDRVNAKTFFNIGFRELTKKDITRVDREEYEDCLEEFERAGLKATIKDNYIYLEGIRFSFALAEHYINPYDSLAEMASSHFYGAYNQWRFANY